jgi:uncharacterized protein YbjT (DUF2867 family)
MLGEHGHDVIAAASDTGVDTLAGEGLTGVLEGASVVIDVSSAPSFEDAAVLEFFETTTGNLLAAEAAAGVTHHVALSVVGTDRLAEGGYFRAKTVQEQLIRDSSIPYSIVRATQFFESMTRIAAAATDGDAVRLPPVFIQPIAADDVASAVVRVAAGLPLNDIVDIAGPGPFRRDELVRRVLKEANDPREVVTDTRARFLGISVSQRTLLPSADAILGETRIQDMLAQLATA